MKMFDQEKFNALLDAEDADGLRQMIETLAKEEKHPSLPPLTPLHFLFMKVMTIVNAAYVKDMGDVIQRLKKLDRKQKTVMDTAEIGQLRRRIKDQTD